MKTVTFIRHYKLVFPFDKKENISHEQFVKLSKGEIDPSINSDIQDYCLKELDKEKYSNFDFIFTSPSKRTIESADALKKIYKINAKIEVSDLLKECIWNPNLEGDRIERFINGSELSNLKGTWERIKKLDEYLRSLKYSNILCFSHSFFMQIVYLYYFGKFKNWNEISISDIQHSFHGDYLKGFDVKP